MTQSRIVELTNIIATEAPIVENYFSSHGIPLPSFDVDGPTRVVIPPSEQDVLKAHVAVVGATKELHDLMIGPTAMLMAISPNDLVSLHAIYKYNIATSFPINEETTFEKISAACGLNVIDLRRLLRHAMTNQIFAEPQPGIVKHTAASKLLAEDPLLWDFVGINCEERFPAAARTVDALLEYDGAHDPAETGFSLGHNTDKGLYEELRKYPERGRRWAGAMTAYASKIPLDPLAKGFDWASFDGGTVVDVGGGYGPVSIGLAQRFPNLKFIVQDFADVVAEGPSHLPPNLHGQISFMPYNFLHQQPVLDADIYFFRAVFHNWPDEYCIQILRNQIRALRPGTHLVINESCMHAPNTLPAFLEKRRRSMDLSMLTYFGSRERTFEDWQALLQGADARFVLRTTTTPGDPPPNILHVVWEG